MTHHKTRILILGANGMLGSSLFRQFHGDPNFETFGSLRSQSGLKHFAPDQRPALIPNVHAESEAGILTALAVAKPEYVVNCIGIIKQLPNASDHLESIAINATLPHRIAKYCATIGARLIHFSTDCVFSGKHGAYFEACQPDADDLYGRTKLLGEVDYGDSVTLRTSIIGHELSSAKSLIDWFLSQSGDVKGFTKAVFSGLPTIEIGQVLKNFVIPNPQLRGLFHLSVDPISKYDLLQLVASTYGKNTHITPDADLVIDRSLNSDRFRTATGFNPRPWPELIQSMHEDYLANK